MHLTELAADQRRQYIDSKQAFEAWRNSRLEFDHSYRGSLHWRKVKGHEYLSRKYGNRWEQVGPRSLETEKIKEEYIADRNALTSRLRRLGKKTEQMALINKALGIGRVPAIAAKVLRKLDEKKLLGSHVFVAGTHCLYAFEARSGVLFNRELTATGDIDFLWDSRQRFTFLMKGINERGVIGLLQQVDDTFKRTKSYRAENSDAYFVEVIRPVAPNELGLPPQIVSDAAGDFEPAAIEGLQWLLNAPKFEEIAIGEDGKPLFISCVDPRAFAVHKLWLSRQPTREGIKRQRDRLQAEAVASVAMNYMGLQFDRASLSAISKEVVDGAKELEKIAKRQINLTSA